MDQLLLGCGRGGGPAGLVLASSSCSQNSLGVTLNTEEPFTVMAWGHHGTFRKPSVVTAFKKENLQAFPVMKTPNSNHRVDGKS